MAQKVQVALVDDLDGSEATQTVKFAFEGREYEIDLSDKNAEKLSKALRPYLDKARRVGGRKTRVGRPGRRAAASREESQAIRAWARRQGIQISDRGRIPADVQRRYEQAHRK
ncbi:histone-like nucleoid-structuring protein Lsr2 [Gandjariella thermophila]|uniref:Lsr2 family protein n=1 Tax=Gandjariella thermophila TaxID=1931992 RepID=A0A4D4JBP6_9PSEU|nr:Lsr2 family protein [Gandjariella thermophila]GDY31799.1 Lsr2 family protein [Gandjariella thermophila]